MGVKRITTPVLLVIDVLTGSAGREHYGYGIAEETGLAPGTIQPILSRLEGEGWLEARWERIDPRVEGRRPRRLYRVTAAGAVAMRRIAEKHRHRIQVMRNSGFLGELT